jgi:hypothetical protein
MIVGVLASTQPTPPKLTFGASHMIAPINLFRAKTTFWALNDPM